MRKPRQPNRSDEQKLEDLFADLALDRQAAMLETLAKLHRWATRKREQPQPEQPEKERTPAELLKRGREIIATSSREVPGPSELMMEKTIDLRSVLADALAVTKETKQ